MMTRITTALKRLRSTCCPPEVFFWSGVAVFLALVVVGATGGARGSDQYWYLADLETLVKGEPHFSNSLFPRQLLRDGIERSPFFHNILPQYAAIPLAKLLGPYTGWIAMNLLAMVLAAYLTRKAALVRGDPWLAAFLGVVVLLLPLSVWQGCQVLAEPALMPLFAAAILLVHRPGGWLTWFLLALVLVLALMSRFTSLALLPVLPLVVLVAPLPVKRKLLGCLMVVGVMGVGFLLNRWLFGGGAAGLRGSGLTIGIVTRGMSVWYNSEPVTLTASAIQEKLLYSIGTVLEGTLANKMMLATNYGLLLLAAVGAAVAVRRKAFGFSLFVLSVIAMNLATLLLFQNQARYVVPSYPVLLVAAGYPLALLAAYRPRVFRAVLPLALLAIIVAACPAALKGRKEGLKESSERAQLATLSEKMQGPGDVISVGTDLILAYSFNPRVVLFVSPKQSGPDLDRILSMPRWRWIFCQGSQTALFSQRQVELKVLHHFEFRGATWGLYELPARVPQ